MSAENVHKLTKKIQLMAEEKFHIFMTVGIYAIDAAHNPTRAKIRDAAKQYPGVLGVHGIFIDDEMKYSSFDVLVDFTVLDKDELKSKIQNDVAKILPEYEISINFDTNYSD